MNREIKFRAWICNDDEGCFMAKWNRHVKKAFGTFLARDGNDTAHLMQYTGLTDKNGREVYEGDIVEDSYVAISENSSEVYFQRGAFWVNYGGAVKLLANRDMDQIEVVGNKLENPELRNDKDT